MSVNHEITPLLLLLLLLRFLSGIRKGTKHVHLIAGHHDFGMFAHDAFKRRTVRQHYVILAVEVGNRGSIGAGVSREIAPNPAAAKRRREMFYARFFFLEHGELGKWKWLPTEMRIVCACSCLRT